MEFNYSNMKNLTTKRKGIIAEEYAKIWFLEQGYSVSVPIGDDDRYDFIVDVNGLLLRMQNKKSNLTRKPGYLNFKTVSWKHNNTNGNSKTRYSEKDIDYFCTVHPETKQVYIIPVEECGNECSLRLTSIITNNKNIKKAEDYEGTKILKKILNS